MQATHKLSLFLCFVAGMAQWGHAQSFSFTASAHSDPTDTIIVSAEGVIDFNQWATSGKVTVWLENTSSPEQSAITGFYLARPLLFPSGDMVTGDAELTSIPGSWEYESSLDTQFNNLANQFDTLDHADYFGASNLNPEETLLWSGVDPLPGPSAGVFTFTFGDGAPQDPLHVFNWMTESPDNPVVFIRWQSIGPDNEESAKSYAYVEFDDIIITPVPEPSEIALMSLVGLGGLLWMRKRYLSKKTQ